jgi:hypothetical protein
VDAPIARFFESDLAGDPPQPTPREPDVLHVVQSIDTDGIAMTTISRCGLKAFRALLWFGDVPPEATTPRCSDCSH